MKRIHFTIIIFSFINIISCKKQSNTEEVIIINEVPESSYGCAPLTTDAKWYENDNKAPLLKGLDVLNSKITTNNPEVQKYFNQGLVLAYGFNHAEAARSFYYSTKLDPECAMSYWGYAYVLGPNYNAGMEDDNYERAFTAIQKAKELSVKVSDKEKAMIDAMSKRYVAVPPEDRSLLDLAYSEATKVLYETYPNDSEIAFLYAESLMNLHPWDLYEKDGSTKEWTPKILDVLEKAIEKHPNHPGAHHFYIHATEASDSPEKSLKSAKKLADKLVPGSGHLIHMASHTYIRTGDYHLGTASNIKAVEADSSYVTQCHAQGAYPLAYYPHNYHFMAATATLEGNSKWAMIGANKVSEHVHPDIMKEPGWGTLQHYYTIPYYVAVKLGKWDKILNMKLDNFGLKYPTAIQHYATGMAYLGKKEIEKANIELTKLQEFAVDESLKEITVWDINTVFPLVQIASKVLKSEILATEGNYDESISLLKEAVEIEDALNYDEPPDWFFSVRHHLGAVQIEANKYDDAIKTYERDLKRFPKNGWSHHGLKLAYEKLNKPEKVKNIEVLLKESWATADIQLTGSRVK